MDCVAPPSQPSLTVAEPELRLVVRLPDASLDTEPVLDGYLGLRPAVVFMVADENADEHEGFLSFLFTTPVVVSRSQATF